MEGLVGLLIMIFIFVSIASSGKKKNPANPNAQKRRSAPDSAAAAAQLRRNVAQWAKKTGMTEEEYVRRLPARLQAQYRSALPVQAEGVDEPEDFEEEEDRRAPGTVGSLPYVYDAQRSDEEANPSGSLPYAYDAQALVPDDEGCLGGSMPHEHTEGEHREEHAQHLESAEAHRRAEAVQPGPSPRQRLGLTAGEMRRAVVISEVLGRPKALSARGRAR